MIDSKNKWTVFAADADVQTYGVGPLVKAHNETVEKLEEANAEIGRLREKVLQAVEEEPEFPDDMPKHIWDAVKNNKGAMTSLLRITVRVTKSKISGRINGVFDSTKE